jgi:hypothetical protein
MSITFHCEHCGKKIEAPDSIGGKWGKCPACHNKVYVPNPSTDEEIKLAPIDENENEKQQQLMAETYKLTQDILLEREDPNGANEASTTASYVDDKQLMVNINGKINQAENFAGSIVASGNRAVKILDEIALSEIPEPELADIPPQVLSGLIRTLRAKIR